MSINERALTQIDEQLAALRELSRWVDLHDLIRNLSERREIVAATNNHVTSRRAATFN